MLTCGLSFNYSLDLTNKSQLRHLTKLLKKQKTKQVFSKQ